MKKITKRDVQFFILGALTCLIVNLITDSQGTLSAFKKGFNDGFNDGLKESEK
jgi:hypothetical protein